MPCERCPVRPGLDCYGTFSPGACDRQATDDAFRASLVRRAELLDAWPRVQACPHRGPVLPPSRLEDCGCQGRELAECRARLGPAPRPDAVTVDECARCVGPV